jgi:hypothetical protein
MKKILFALAMLAFGASALLQQARGQDVSIDFFYNNLSGGNWIEVEGYGYGWQPDIAVSDPNWRPYADGYWAYTDYGWTWISYEDFGWAAYHYGRWANLSDYGWIWFPGSDLDWGPAWVSWRTGGDYIGWAPLPPRGPGIVYEGQSIGARVDIEFDIGPQYYNFCDVRFIGEPVLRDRIFPPTQNVTYIDNTVNVTNITVQNNVVYNYGPDYNVVNTYSTRPIQRLTVERQSPTNLSAAAKSGALTKVQGNKLVVAAPNKIAKAPPTAKPPAIKTKVAQPKINRGWAGVQNEAQVKQKIQTENPKNVPPPTRAAARAPGSPAPAAPGAPAKPAASPGKPGAVSPAAPSPRGVTTPAVTPRAPAPRATPPEKRTLPGRPGTTPPGKVSPEPRAPGRALEKGKPTPQPRFTPERAPGAGVSPGIERKPPPKAAVSPDIERKPPAGGPPPPSRRTPPSKPGVAPETPGATEPAERARGRIEPGPARPTPRQPGGPGNVPEQAKPQPPGAATRPGAAAPPEGRAVRERRPGEGAPPAGAVREGKPERGKKKPEETPAPRP